MLDCIMNGTIVIGAIAFLILLILLLSYISSESEKRRSKNRILAAEREQQRLERETDVKNQKENEYNRGYEDLVSSYGPCAVDLVIGWDRLKLADHLFVFEGSSTIVVQGEALPFAKILGCSLYDEPQTVENNETKYVSTTKTSTGNMIGRAIVGGILLGGVGALAGAITAKTETTTTPISSNSTSKVNHHYRLLVNVDDFAQPTRLLKFGSDLALAQKVLGVFELVVKRNS